MNTEEPSIPKKENNEVKTLKYKTTILGGLSWPENNNKTNNMQSLEKFLENEKITNSAEPWNKLDKTAKIKKLLIFSEKYKSDNELSEEEYNKLVIFLKDCLDRKKLQRVKDIKYDLSSGEVKEIPALTFNKSNNHFTLKNNDKKVSTIRGGLAPKKKQGTIKNIVNNADNSDDEDEDNDT
jgi:hypothetical protein